MARYSRWSSRTAIPGWRESLATRLEYLSSGKRFGSDFAVARERARGAARERRHHARRTVRRGRAAPADPSQRLDGRSLARRSARRVVRQRRRGDSWLRHAARGFDPAQALPVGDRHFMAVPFTSTATSSILRLASTRRPATRCWRSIRAAHPVAASTSPAPSTPTGAISMRRTSAPALRMPSRVASPIRNASV